MAYYNLTNITAANNTYQLTEAVNQLSGGWLMLCFMMSFTVIIFLSLKDYPTKEAFAASAFISVVLAILLRVISMISDFVLFVYIILAVIAIISLFYNK